jgi:TolB-like protein
VSLFNELKRRNVFRVAAAYVVVGWLFAQIAELVFDAFGFPEWTLQALMVLIALGLPIALIFSWAFEVTPEGVQRESEVSHDTGTARASARRLDLITIGAVVLAIGIAAWSAQHRSAGSALQPEVVAPIAAVQDETLPSVAVLPFANMSADADNEYFADGISEEILNLLADVRDLSVASRTSAFAYKGKDTSIPDIAAALGVRYVLEGSVRKSGQQVRITAQLIDASNDRHLWSETYDRTLDDIFAIQDEIAGAIGDALQIELLGEGGRRVAAEAIDPEIYAQFLEARHLLRRRNEADLRRANELLIHVVEAEPRFARGHVVLGEAYLLNSGSAVSLVPAEIGDAQARMHAEIARGLDPDLAGIYLILGNLREDATEVSAALADFTRAIELEPEEPRSYHWRGIAYSGLGYLDLARADLEQAVRLEPENANVHGWYSTILSAYGDLDGAIAEADLQAEYGNPVGGYSQSGLYELHRGDVDAAAARIERSIAAGDDAAELLRAMIAAARDPEAKEGLRQVIEGLLTPENARSGYGAVYSYLVLGMNEDTLELLGSYNAFGSFPTLLWNDSYRELRQDPRFVEYMERSGRADVWRELGPPADCRAEAESFRCGYGFGR